MKLFAMRHLDKEKWPLVAVMALALIAGHAAGQSDEQKLLASDGAANERFGFAVSISGPPGNGVAIVGAYWDDDNGTQSGSAYIYRESGATWVFEQKLLASDGATADGFGISVSISGTPGNEVAIVGALWDDDNGTDSGSAYIYRFNGASWVEEAKLLASDGAEDDQFGRSVSISGAPGNEVAIVGAYLDDDNDSGSGSAYVYRKSGPTWVEEAKLLASDGAAFDQFGESVSISDDVAIVGASRHGGNGTWSGSAYIYRLDSATWVEEAKLLASDGAEFDQFGFSVSINGTPGNEVAIVGAIGSGGLIIDFGSAYIYRKSGPFWVQEQKLLASDGAIGNQFGVSVSISGTTGNEIVIVGAYLDDNNGILSGSAYIYRKSGPTWVEVTKLLASDGASGNEFGWSVSISDDVAIVGAWRHTDNGPDSGAAYIYSGLSITGLSGDCNGNGINDLHDLFLHKTSADCNDNGIPDECDIAFGASLDLDADGIPDECLASCPPDTNGEGFVNVTDLLALLAAWGVCP